MKKNFEDREQRVLSFMEHVEEIEKSKQAVNTLMESEDYKLEVLDKEEEKGKGICLDMLFSKIYKDALPLNDDYKVAHAEDLDAEMKDFMAARNPKGMEYYVKEAIKQGSKPAKQIMDGVDKVVDDDYDKKALDLDNLDTTDMAFQMDTDKIQKIDEISDDMGVDAITDIIKNNVKNTAMSEIQRAKDEKESIQTLEDELANDMSITTPEQVQEAVELRGYNTKKDFVPTLFQGIMIGNVNKYNSLYESGNLESEFLYDTLTEFGMNKPEEEKGNEASVDELAFVESVKELTKINIVKALKLEKFGKSKLEEMAKDYAEN